MPREPRPRSLVGFQEVPRLSPKRGFSMRFGGRAILVLGTVN